MSSPNPENSRSSVDVEHLNKLEAIVRRGLDTDHEVGNALAEISDHGFTAPATGRSRPTCAIDGE